MTDRKKVVLRYLEAAREVSREPSHAIFISASSLREIPYVERFTSALSRHLQAFAERRILRLFEVTESDFVLFMRESPNIVQGLQNESRILLLRLVETAIPEYFGMINQDQMVRVLDLEKEWDKLIKLINACKPLKPEQGQDLKRLGLEHIRGIEAAMHRLGPETFARQFIQTQPICLCDVHGTVQPMIQECFIGLEGLKKAFFPDVSIKHSTNVFNQMTLTLDRVLLRSIGHLDVPMQQASINLNVETVFSRDFERFQKSLSGGLASLSIEFRISDILQNYDEFELARNVILDNGGTITIDAVIPQMLDLVNIDRLGARMCKVFWRPGSEATLTGRSKALKTIQDSGTVIVLARAQDKEAIHAGHQLGVHLFQGFFVDDMLARRKKAAQAKAK